MNHIFYLVLLMLLAAKHFTKEVRNISYFEKGGIEAPGKVFGFLFGFFAGLVWFFVFCTVYSPSSFPLSLKNTSVTLISSHLLKIIVKENLLADVLK